MDPPMVMPTNPTPITTVSGTGLEPTDPLEGLEGPEPTPTEGCGAGTKRPSTYARRILTSEGSTSGDINDRSLPHRVAGTSIAKAAQDDTDAPPYAMVASIPAGTEPRNEAEAQGSPDWLHWQDTMAKEVSELTTKHTWELVDTPLSINIIGSRWTYWLKHDTSGAITRYKAHLVAQGFTQATSIDHNMTFAPIAKFASNQVVLALATHNDWEVHQVDMKNTYLNAKLTETIYMRQPPGFATPGDERQVCHLFKALYSLKQTGRCWYQ